MKFFLVSLVFYSLSFSAEITAAVLPFTAQGADSIYSTTFSDRLRSELVLGNQFKILEREQMNLVLQEHGFQQTLCTSAECMQEICTLLNVDELIIGSYHRIGKILSVNAKRVSVKTGQISQSSSFDYSGDAEGFLSEGIPKLARQIENQNSSRLSASQTVHYEKPLAWSLLGLSALSFGTALWFDSQASKELTHFKSQIDENFNPSTSKLEEHQNNRDLFYILGGASLLGSALFFWSPWIQENQVSFSTQGIQWHYYF